MSMLVENAEASLRKRSLEMLATHRPEHREGMLRRAERTIRSWARRQAAGSTASQESIRFDLALTGTSEEELQQIIEDEKSGYAKETQARAERERLEKEIYARASYRWNEIEEILHKRRAQARAELERAVKQFVRLADRERDHSKKLNAEDILDAMDLMEAAATAYRSASTRRFDRGSWISSVMGTDALNVDKAIRLAMDIPGIAPTPLGMS